MIQSTCFTTSEFGMAWNGTVWHLMIGPEQETTRCGKTVALDWQIGQPTTISDYSSYCKKCLRHVKSFTVLQGTNIYV